MSEILQRLRERKLGQWAIAYVAAAFALLQAFDLVAQRFGLPEAIERALIVAVAIGFFATVILAWYHGEKGRQRVSGTELLILALLLAVGGGVMWRVAQSPRETAGPATARADRRDEGASAARRLQAAPASDKSIAVLPFANMSKDPDNAYFADGMQDEILTRLAKISALRVVSRTSAQRFSGGTDRNLGEIALQLGVANILEGSVQKAGNKVHINVQLIEAVTDKHLWAESYNRTLDDIFGVEGEVAQAVAEALKATLTGAERAVVTAKGTENPAAYEAYLRGRVLDNGGLSFVTSQKAVDSYLAAAREDPKFAQAWAGAAVMMAQLYFNGYDTARSTEEAVRDAADTAMRLQPELAESLWARGGYLYWVKHDYTKAYDSFRRAAEKQPGDADTLSALFYIERRMGRWNDAITHYRETLVRDPRNVSLRVQGAREILYYLRRFDETRGLMLEALKIAPDETVARACLAEVEQQLGRLDAADAWLARVPKDSSDYYGGVAHIDQAMYRRDLGALSAQTEPATRRADADLTGTDFIGLIRLGHLQRVSGHADAARATFERLARAIAARPGGLDHVASAAPLTPLVYAGLGDHAKAITAARHQLEVNGDDVIERAFSTTVLAQMLALKGDRDAAIAMLPELMEMPAGPTPALLTIDPMWDPLRDDPRFVELTKRPLVEAKVAPP